MIHEVFNFIIKQDPMTPSSWKKVMITVIPTEKETRRSHKLSTNLFLSNAVQTISTILYNRLTPNRQLPIPWAGRIDHLVTYSLDAPESRAWETDMWVVAIVFQKAFDSIQHDAMWRSLRHFSISEQYICLLKKLYADQRATVLTDWNKGRWSFEQPSFQLGSSISNGERHWDLERKGLGHQTGWRKKETAYPTCVLLTTRLWRRTLWCNSKGWLRTSKIQKRKGLTFTQRKRPSHQSEIKQIERDRDRRDACRNASSLKYLVQMITFMNQAATEVQHRIRCAWSAFARHRQELTSKSYLLRHFFDAVVAPTIMYSDGTCGLQQRSTNKSSAQHSAECFVSSFRRREKTKRQKRQTKNIEVEKTFLMKKWAKTQKKTAQTMKITKIAVSHSRMTQRAHQAKKRNSKIGFST